MTPSLVLNKNPVEIISLNLIFADMQDLYVSLVQKTTSVRSVRDRSSKSAVKTPFACHGAIDMVTSWSIS